MDFINICVTLFVWHAGDPCEQLYTRWYICNGALSLFSLIWLTWFVNAQLSHNYQTKNAEYMTYALEACFVVSSLSAWHLFNVDLPTECQTQQNKP